MDTGASTTGQGQGTGQGHAPQQHDGVHRYEMLQYGHGHLARVAQPQDEDNDHDNEQDHDLEQETPASSGAASTPTSSTSSPPQGIEEPSSPQGSWNGVFSSGPSGFFGGPSANYGKFAFGVRRGPGRPRKEGVKTIKEGKIVRRYRVNNMGYMRGFKKHRSSRDENLEELFDEGDMLLTAPEEPPYFVEKWPGKICILCNLSERSQLGQGEMQRISCDLTRGVEALTPTVEEYSEPQSTNSTYLHSQIPLASGRRQKNLNKCKTPSCNPEHTDELSIIGYSDVVDIQNVADNEYVYVHKNCLEWSQTLDFKANIVQITENQIADEEKSKNDAIKAMVLQSLQRKCSFCLHFGASITCKMSCTKYFHYPCVLASGGFQEITTRVSFCKEHIYQVPLVCTVDIDCHTCGLVGDMANLMTCCTCNAHHHGTCVGLPQLPGVRAGWNCRQCRVCQVCHGEGSDSGETRAIACEQCDKLYHAACIRPIMTTVPKYGWKCKCCRICSDCGSRSPGAGASSRWHAHYTVCDSCYQQRNKGLSCPLCRRAYRAAAQREMVQCSHCKRYVHGTCDSEADLVTYQLKKESVPDYEYVCLMCKSIEKRAPLQRRKDSMDDDSLSISHESLFDENFETDPLAFDTRMDIGLGKGKPYHASKIAKKKLGMYKVKGIYGTSCKVPYHKRQRGFMDFTRKRGTKPKMRGVFGVPGLGLQRPQSQDSKGSDDEPGVENRLVLVSSKDKFVLSQDICVMCGALGTDSEGCLIACAQCGQTYHPYCVNIKVNSVIVQKGWRCLDCTACEGCGRRDDEARLVLCDDCDVSYHTYCARPPLTTVPRGCWRCSRCRKCQICGSTDPGPDNNWMNGYTECGPCASLATCPVCSSTYSDGELIVQCLQCRRWLHGACDSMQSEKDADLCCQRGYSCLLCRPRDCPPPHLGPPPQPLSQCLLSQNMNGQNLMSGRPPSPGEFYLDGVCLSAGGLRAIRAMQGEGIGMMHGRKRRKPRLDGTLDKSAGILAAIEAVVQGGECDNDDNKLDSLLDMKDDAANSLYKEGMTWSVTHDGPPPEGFTLYTTESGLTVLRRKRQRNLNRVGIGGFTVRMRAQGPRNSRMPDGEMSNVDGNDSLATTPTTPTGNLESPTDKRKKPRRKPRSRLMEAFPSYMQEAFFGRDLLETPPGLRSDVNDYLSAQTNSDSEDSIEIPIRKSISTICLNKEELEAIEVVKSREEKERKQRTDTLKEGCDKHVTNIKTEVDVSGAKLHAPFIDDAKALKEAMMQPNILPSEKNINSIPSNNKMVCSENKMPLHQNDQLPRADTNISPKEEISLLAVNLESIVRDSLPNMDSRDVEEIFKGVLTDDSQESQESSVSFVNSVSGSSSYNPQRQQLSSPMEYPSPYHTEYSGNSQLSPAYSENSGQWSASGGGQHTGLNNMMSNVDVMGTDSSTSQPSLMQNPPSTYNQRSTEKMKADESLGSGATISAVLYANLNHPEWKTEYPNWPDRCKQILKKWRALASDKKTPYLQQARDNRGAIRMKKAQQISKDGNAAMTPGLPDNTIAATSVESTTNIEQTTEVPLHKDGITLTNASATNTPSPIPNPPTPESTSFAQISNPTNNNTNNNSSTSVVTGFTSSHFTLHHQFNPFYHGSSGPAPNVTVNPYGKFTTSGGAHKALVRTTPSGSQVTVGILQQPQTQNSSNSVIRHNITGAIFSQALSFLGKSQVIPHSISSIIQNGGQTQKTENTCEASSRSRSCSPSSPSPASPPGDLQIRVLTPSEIMRTLPSMPQELAYEQPTHVTEQEKLTGHQRGAREAEQERQWKQLQQLRQQQAQHQQQVIHDQRLQAMARVQRQMTNDGGFASEQLQVSINEQSPLHSGGMASPSPTLTLPRSPYPSTGTPTRFPHPSLVQVRPTNPQRLVQSPFSPQSPHDAFPGSVSPAQSQGDPFQRPPSENSGDYMQSPQTPRSFGQQSPNPARSPAYVSQPRIVPIANTPDVYAQAPGTPRPGTQFNVTPQRNQIYAPRPNDLYMPNQNQMLSSARNENMIQQQQPLEVNRQLRDLLQRHAPNKLWSQNEEQQSSGISNSDQQSQLAPDGQFRQPLPVSPVIRPRMPITNADPRARFTLQNQVGPQQQRNLSSMILQGVGNNHLGLRIRPQIAIDQQNSQPNVSQRQNAVPTTTAALQRSQPPTGTVGSANTSTEDIQDMDMEKLEQDTANMAEVGDILGGLGDDEEELLVSLTAEIGDDFNILEYADPELAEFGDTSHILDGLELVEETEQGQHAKREPVEDDVKTDIIKTETNVAKAEKKENLLDSSEIKLENTYDSDNIDKLTAQKLSNDSNNQSSLPRLDLIQNSQVQQIRQNIVTGPNQQIRVQQFRNNVSQGSMVHVQGQQQQINITQKIVRQNIQTSNIDHPRQFPQMIINKSSNVQQQNPNQLNRNQVLINNRTEDKMQNVEINTQNAQTVQFQQGQHIKTQFNAQGQVLSQQPQVLQPQQQSQQTLQQQQQLVQQQMQSQVTAALAMGRPMAPGTRLMSPDGAMGVVTMNNSVTVTYPPVFPHHRPQHARVGVGMGVGIRGVVRATPPPPPYPGTPQRMQNPQQPPPPPPYPSQIIDSPNQADPWGDWLRVRRPLLLQEQPLLLEELLEQEKREQGRQTNETTEGMIAPNNATSTDSPQQQWPIQTSSNNQQQIGSVPLYNLTHLPAPPLPPERIVTEADHQSQIAYEQWLQHQNTLLMNQLKYYETEVQKLRKIRKSLNSKQRQLRKSGNELAAPDAAELARVSGEQSVLQKHLESARKQSRQHSMLIQEYRNKQQQQQQSQNQTQTQINIIQSPNVNQQLNITNQGVNIQQQFTMNEHNSNISQVPVSQQNISMSQIQSNSSQIIFGQNQQISQDVQNQNNIMQQQLQSHQQPLQQQQHLPSQQMQQQSVHLNQIKNQVNQTHTIVNQQRRLNTMVTNVNQFVQNQNVSQQQASTQLMNNQQIQQNTQHIPNSPQMQIQGNISNQPQQQMQVNQQHMQVSQQQMQVNQQQMQVSQQQMQVNQQQLVNVQQLQQNQPQMQHIQQQMMSNQTMQMQQNQMNQQHTTIQGERNMMTQSHHLYQQGQQMQSRSLPSPSPQTPNQMQNMHSPVTSGSPQLQNVQSGSLSGNASPQTGSTPPPPFSPQSMMASGARSPQVAFPRPQGSPLQTRFARPPNHHAIHQQGMRVGSAFNSRQSSPLGSPQPLMSPGGSSVDVQRQQILQRQQYSPMGQPPSSPLSRSPLIGNQPPSSPLSARSPLIAPQSTPSPSPQPNQNQDLNGGGGGGNLFAPLPPELSNFRYFKIGLRGGTPMWGLNKANKRIGESAQGSSNQPSDQVQSLRPKKESHISKVSILKKKHPTKTHAMISAPTHVTNAKITSLVNSEYNDLDDSSSTPPVSPGKIAQTVIEGTKEMKCIGKKEDDKINIKSTKTSVVKTPIIEIPQSDEDIVLIDSSPDETKQQILDYDDENDKNFVGAEVSLCAAAADSDQGELSVIEPFPPVEISDIAASPLDTQEYVLFSSDGVDYTVDSDDSLKQLSFIQKDNSVVIQYRRQASESNDDYRVPTPIENSEDEIVITEEASKKPNTTTHEKKSVQNRESVAEESESAVSSNIISPEEHISTEEDFEELIDSGKPEDTTEDEQSKKEKMIDKTSSVVVTSVESNQTTTITRTETTKKTVAVINLAAAKTSQSPSALHQFKIVNTAKTSGGITRLPVISAAVISPHTNTKMLNEASQATVASVSIANQTISVPVLKTLNVPVVPLNSGQGNLTTQMKKVPITISAPSISIPLSKPISSMISVISPNISNPRVATLSPVITLATSTAGGTSKMPIPILTQQHLKPKIVKTIEKTVSISTSKISVSQDTTLPAKIFQDDSVSDRDDTATNSSDSNTPKLNISSAKEVINTKDKKIKVQNIKVSTSVASNVKNKIDVDIENEISKQTELPHKNISTLLTNTPEIIKSSERVSEKIPDNIMEGDDEDKVIKAESSEPKILIASAIKINDVCNESYSNSSLGNLDTIKGVANQTKELVIDSNMRITSDVAQESIQISIPSPTPSQEQYLDNISLQAQENDSVVNPNTLKKVETFEEMLNMLNNMTGENKIFPIKLRDQVSEVDSLNTAKCNSDAIADLDDVIRQDLTNSAQKKAESLQESNKSTIPVHVILRSRESSQSPITVATSRVTTMPQLSPLSKPAELTNNIANVSQQLRTIMSSINTSKTESTSSPTITSIKKLTLSSDLGTSTQVNFENLLPSTKVEVVTSKSSNRGLIEKAFTNSMTSSGNNHQDNPQQRECGSPLAGRNIRIQSPHNSPSESPRQSPHLHSKSPNIQISQANTTQEEPTSTSIQGTIISQQIIQMPALSKIQSTQAPTSIAQPNFQISNAQLVSKGQIVSTNILSSTLMQSSRHILNTNVTLPLQTISSSQPPALIMSSKSTIPLQTQQSISSTVVSSLGVQIAKSNTSQSIITTSKLLHSQLTSPLKRSKSTDEPKTETAIGTLLPSKRHSLESVVVKSEPMECDELGLNSGESSGCKFSSVTTPQKADESQNVLLKQLLQNSVSTAPAVIPQRSGPSLLSSQRAAPSLGIVPSLEAQLARPSIPPPHLPATPATVDPPISQIQVQTRETYVSRPSIATSSPSLISVPVTSVSVSISSTQSLMDVRKPLSKLIIREDLPTTLTSVVSSSTPTYSMSSNEMSPQIKKELIHSHQSPLNQSFIPQDVKKELLDESSQQSAISGISVTSDQSKLESSIKEELSDTLMSNDPNLDLGILQETAQEAKKRKRREYQQKRRQMQSNLKLDPNKKKQRRISKVEEDYDTFIDNLMIHMRQLPPMQVQEPILNKNYGVCPVFGSGELSKIGSSKDYNIRFGDLSGNFGNGCIPNIGDFYNIKPFGDDEVIPEKPPVSTQRGFYDQEFSPIKLDNDSDEKKLEYFCKERDIDTPDTIVSSSSPECCLFDEPNPFPGLKLIDEESDHEEDFKRSNSPVIPIIVPIPIRVKSVPLHLDLRDSDKENICNNATKDHISIKSKMVEMGDSLDLNENVIMTLTLTSCAAEDILGVLKKLAGILQIPPPTSYQIIERTATPPSHRLGLYRSKDKDGKEGTAIDIQSILNGETKFCRHCDVIILDSVVRAKASEFPLLSLSKSSNDFINDTDAELNFCSTQCYKRFAWRPTNILADNKVINNSQVEPINGTSFEIKESVKMDIEVPENMNVSDIEIKQEIQDDKMDISCTDSIDNEDIDIKKEDDDSSLIKDIESDTSEFKSDLKENDLPESPPTKQYRGLQYKYWSPGCIAPPSRYKKPTDREITEMVFRTGVTVTPAKMPDDNRKCCLCHAQGDCVADGPSRLLNYDVDKWVHLNCALWSDGVYETVNGALMNFETAIQTGLSTVCVFCERNGATVRCFKTRCSNVYHLGCAVKDNCVFHKNKTAHCATHIPKGEKENELTTLRVQRRVYVNRDESRQVAAVMHQCDLTYLLRVGGLIFLSVGQILPHQLANFHTPHYIYPIGYKIVRFFWSTRRINTRCLYICSIAEKEGRPEFIVAPQDDHAGAGSGLLPEYRGCSPRAAWAPLLTALATLRERHDTLRLWPDYITGEDLFGLTEPAIVRVLESLPGIDTLPDYRFKYGRNPLLELPLTINSSGAARTEARSVTRGAPWKRSLTFRAPAPATRALAPPLAPPPPPGEHACPYSKQFVHSKSSQYKKMKQEWRNNIYLARSKIQGLGLYAARDLEKHTMVIEYIGEIIRHELSEIREKQYEAKNRGIYMFRLDEDRVIDATLTGGLARYINHSCNPNCVAEAVEVERDVRIIIFAKRRIMRGEELAYDYKFDIEDDAHKISCMCGAPNCRKWMN